MDSECFCVAKEATARQFARASLDSGTDAVLLSGMAAQAAVKVAIFVPEAATADLLWILSDEPALY